MQHFLPKEEKCFCRLYILNYALRQIMGVTGQIWLPTLFPMHAVCCILLVLVFYQLHAPCQSGKGSVGRLSDSGSMDSVQNISQVPWLHLEF